MSTRTVFIPWTRLQGAEFLQLVSDCNAASPLTHGQHTWQAVCYDDPHPNGIIQNLKTAQRIYITGHGSPGSHTIETNGNELKYDEVCDRLIEHGLKRTYVGTIVCNNCYSAVPKPGSQAFAAKVSQYLRGKGYLLISVQGFFGPIDKSHNMRGDHEFAHRYVTNAWGSEVKSKWMAWRF